MTSQAPTPSRSRLASPKLRHLIERVVRPRLPDSAVEDVVQTVLCDAVAAKQLPDEEEQLRRWLVGVARHKVADFHRARSRAKRTDRGELVAIAPSDRSAREWAQWANKQVEGNAEAERTLDWMAREGGGEKLAHIADSEQLPAPQVRQRVSRLRRLMRKRWAAELAGLAAVALAALLAVGVWYELKRRRPVAVPRLLPELAPAGDPSAEPGHERARAQRNVAMHMCAKSSCHDDWQQCLQLLDEAAELDPEGDKAPHIQQMRTRAAAALRAPDSKASPRRSPTDTPNDLLIRSSSPSRPGPPSPTPMTTPTGKPPHASKSSATPPATPTPATPTPATPTPATPTPASTAPLRTGP